MTHLDEELVQRVLHGELTRAGDTVASDHLSECTVCRERVAEAKLDESEIHGLFSVLDHHAPQVLAGAIATRAHNRRSSWRQRAAGLLVAVSVAGTAYSLPGSPMPLWVKSAVQRIGSLAGPSSLPPSDPAPVAVRDHSAVKTPSFSGIAVAPGSALLIQFTRSLPDVAIQVSLTDGAEVVIRAPAGAATFSSEDDRLVIDNQGLTSNFEIQIPRLAPRVEIRVAGKRVFLKDGLHITTQPAAGGEL